MIAENKHFVNPRKVGYHGTKSGKGKRVSDEKQKRMIMLKHKGFTLIEIMLVMAIIGVMSAMVFSSLRSGKEQKEVEGQARRVAAAIREIQNYALTGKQISGQVPCRFGVMSLSIGNTQLVLRESHRTGASCSAGASADANIPGMTVVLANGVRFTADLNASFFFTVPRGELNPNGNATPISLRLGKGSTTYSVCVYPGGQVKDVAGAACP